MLSGKIASLYAVETVDSQSKAQKLNDNRGDFDLLNVYLQVNTSGEGQKSGLADDHETISTAKYIIENCPKLHLKGLMTIGSFSTSVSSTENSDFKVRAFSHGCRRLTKLEINHSGC